MDETQSPSPQHCFSLAEREKDRPNVPSSMATSTTPALISSEQFKSSASILPPLPLSFTAANTKNHWRVRCALSSNNWRHSRRLFSISLVLSNFFLIPECMPPSVHWIIVVYVSPTGRTNSMNIVLNCVLIVFSSDASAGSFMDKYVKK